jgi:hypothetical protein
MAYSVENRQAALSRSFDYVRAAELELLERVTVVSQSIVDRVRQPPRDESQDRPDDARPEHILNASLLDMALLRALELHRRHVPVLMFGPSGM